MFTGKRASLRQGLYACVVVMSISAVSAESVDPVGDAARHNQLDLAGDGRLFLIREASRSSFTLIGGLHGDKETPTLVQDLFGALQPAGYRYLATEMSPWAASRIPGSHPNLWGCDIEEMHPDLIIRDLAAASPDNAALQTMTEMVKAGYRRSLAPELLKLAQQAGDFKNSEVQGISLKDLLIKTLQVEATRQTGTALAGSMARELAMKEMFLAHYRAATVGTSTPKVILAFGQNHLHRGIDHRGVSTLGNFIAELAVQNGSESFHVALFAAGGSLFLGHLQNADQRQDDPAFAFLASVAQFPATVFDLRPLREILHAMPSQKLSPRDAALLYWADSYDAIICYRSVTPVSGELR